MPATYEDYERELAAQGYSRSTVKAKLNAVSVCAKWADVEPHELTRDDVLGWLGSRPRADWTRIKYMQHLAAWGRFSGLPGLVEGIRRPPMPVGVPKPVSEAGLRALLAVAVPGRERAWLLLGAFCGLRAHESAKVAAEDLEQAADGSWLLRVLGKGKQVAVIPCPPVVVAELHAAARRVGAGRLWPRATTRSVQRKVADLADRAGVACSSHQLRHRYGTAVYDLEKDLLMTQQLMRHKSPATTAGYALVRPHRAAAAVAQLPGANGEPGPPGLRLVR